LLLTNGNSSDDGLLRYMYSNQDIVNRKDLKPTAKFGQLPLLSIDGMLC
jgi:hypothetical protein